MLEEIDVWISYQVDLMSFWYISATLNYGFWLVFQDIQSVYAMQLEGAELLSKGTMLPLFDIDH